MQRRETLSGDQVVDHTARFETRFGEGMDPPIKATLTRKAFQAQGLDQRLGLALHTGQRRVTLRTKEVKASFTRSLVSITSVWFSGWSRIPAAMLVMQLIPKTFMRI